VSVGKEGWLGTGSGTGAGSGHESWLSGVEYTLLAITVDCIYRFRDCEFIIEHT